MTDSNSQSLDDVIAIYLEALDSGYSGNPEDFIAQWPQYRAELLQFVAQNKTVDQLFGNAHDLPPDSGSLQSPEFDPESFGSGYRIRQVIGRGGMGTVYEAIRISDNERVAVKILNARTTLNTQHRQRFDRESQAIASLDHPHIVPLYSVGASNDTPFLVMKLIDGVTLSEIVAQRSDVRAAAAECFEAAHRRNDYFSTIVRLIADVAGALEAAHQSNIIHRDVKPSNLLLDRQGKVWLTDFGLASVGDGHATLTGTGDILGTPAFMSPEQALGDHRQIDHRSDIYSLGATLYALAALRNPYVGTGYQILREVSEGPLIPPSRFRSEIPPNLEAIILKSMSRNPAKRYVSAAEFENDLRRFVAGRSVKAKAPGFTDHALQWTTRNPRLTVAALSGLFATVLSVIVIQWVVSHRLTELNDQLTTNNQKLSDLNEELLTSQSNLERNIYAADMSDAYVAFAQGDVDRMSELLARQAPSDGDPEPAGFEWRLLNQLSRPVEVRRFKGHTTAARDVALLPGSSQFMTVGDDGYIRRWDLSSQEPISEFVVDGQLAAIAVSPDQRSFVIGQNFVDGINPVTLRDLKTGSVLQQLTGHEYAVESAAFSPNGQLIATAGRYQDVLIHSIDGTLRHRLTTGSRNESLAFSSGGQHLLTVFREPDSTKPFLNQQLIRVWDVDHMTSTIDMSSDLNILTFAISASCGKLFAASGDQVATIGFPDGTTSAFQDDLRGRVRNVAISADGTEYAAGCDNGLIYLWGAEDQEWYRNRKISEPASLNQVARPMVIDTGDYGVTSLTFAASGELVATNSDGEILICARATRNPRLRHVERFLQLMPSRSARDCYFARCSDGRVMRFDGLVHHSPEMTVSDPVTILDEPIDQYGTMTASPSSELLAAGTPSEIVVVNADTGLVLTRIEFPEPNKPVRSLQFSENGKSLLALFNDRFIAYHTSDWTIHEEVRLPIENAVLLTLSTDGSSIIVVSESTLSFFNADTFQLRQSFSADDGTFSTVATSASGKFYAAGYGDGTTQIVNADALTTVAVLRGHRARVRRVAFLNNDQTMMTFDGDGVVRLWDVTSQRELAVLNTGNTCCLVAEEADALVTWGYAGPMRIWSASPPSQ